MTTTNERIKKLRKALGLTQQEFADRLGVKRGTVATYERGRSDPSDAAVVLICKTFGVSEEWLRTGKGEPFLNRSRDEEIESFVGGLLQDEDDNFRKRFIAMLSKLDVSDWEVLEKMAREMLQDAAEPPVPAGYSSRAELEAEADEFAAMAREQFLSEKIPGYQAFSVNDSGEPDDLLA